MPNSTVTCYGNEIPSFVGYELDRLYGECHSSLLHFQIYQVAGNASTYIVRRDGEASTLFLFRRDKKKIRVLNECIAVEGDEVRRFAAYLFDADRSVETVVFEAVQADRFALGFPLQRYPCAEDTVLALPASVPDYNASLGRSTRENMKRYLNRLQRDFPSFAFSMSDKDAANEQHIRAIIGLNRGRMTIKNKVSSIGDEEEERILRCVKACGYVGIATIDGRFCAGVITYRNGSNFALRILAHDPAFDEYRLGFVCCYLTICECIGQGGKNFNFGWGEYAYKYRLGGIRRQLSRLVVYRSPFHMFKNTKLAVGTAVRGRAHCIKLWILEAAKKESHVLSRPARTMVRAGRWWKAMHAAAQPAQRHAH
jgi:hypothetical protein